MNLLYIAVGGALGAVLRYLAGNAAVKYFNPQLPYGTFIINISGCFLMGLLMTLIVDHPSGMKYIRFLRKETLPALCYTPR